MSQIDSSVIASLEERIRGGDQASVREFLRDLRRSDIPDRLILSVSQIARRVGWARKGLILLHDRVTRPRPTFVPDAREQAEYAACLLKLGGVTEAKKILSSIPRDRSADVIKYQAFCSIHQWDYGHAIPLLKEYIHRSDVSPYDRMVGSINLAAALIGADEYRECEDILIPLAEKLRADNYRLLFGNARELLAQIHIHTGRFDSAGELLDEAWSVLKDAQPRYLLYLQKWRAIASLIRDPSDPSAAKNLAQVRQRAIEDSVWEVARECDLYHSIHCQDESLFHHLYFGTPYPHYQQFMIRKKKDARVPHSYLWRCPDSRHLVDVEQGSLEGRPLFAKGLGRHRLLKALSLDFYAPAPVIEVFNQIFDGEYYHPETSPARVHEMLRRLRRDLAENRLTLPIVSHKNGYRIDILSANCSLKVSSERKVRIPLIDEIQLRYGASEFSLRQLAEDLGLPHTTVYRRLKDLISEGTIQCIGNGRQARYQMNGAAAKRPA